MANRNPQNSEPMSAHPNSQDLPPDMIAVEQQPTGFGGRIRNYFLTGLVVAGPLAVTAWLIWSFVTWVDDLVRPLTPEVYRPETYLPWKIPGTGLVIAFVALTFLGFLTANLVGRTLLQIGENLLDRMPVVRPIYKTVKQIFTMLFSKSGTSFRRPACGRSFSSRSRRAPTSPRACRRGTIRYRSSCPARQTRPPAFFSTFRAA
jgi:hypothetical protein